MKIDLQFNFSMEVNKKDYTFKIIAPTEAEARKILKNDLESIIPQL